MDSVQVKRYQTEQCHDDFIAHFLGKCNMNVVIDSVSTVTGTASNDIFQNYKKMMSPYDNRLRDIMMTFWSKNSAGTLTKEEEKALNTQYETILDSVNDINKSFIMNGNLDNEVGAYIFLISNQNLDEGDIIEIIDAAGPRFKAYPQIDNFVKRAEILKSVTIGKPFVELTMQDVNGKEVKLSDFAGEREIPGSRFLGILVSPVPCRSSGYGRDIQSLQR